MARKILNLWTCGKCGGVGKRGDRRCGACKGTGLGRPTNIDLR